MCAFMLHKPTPDTTRSPHTTRPPIGSLYDLRRTSYAKTVDFLLPSSIAILAQPKVWLKYTYPHLYSYIKKSGLRNSHSAQYSDSDILICTLNHSL